MIDNSVLVEDGKTYLVIDTILYNNIKYVYFGNQDDYTDFFIRKQIEKDEKNILVNLDNPDEFNLALNLFTEKHKND